MKNNRFAASLNADRKKLSFIDKQPPEKIDMPAGPFRLGNAGQKCSLLIFVPRNPNSSLVNLMTGNYGYSHLAIDCGELDIPTGKCVMIESTFGNGVHYGFQDEYGKRKFVRIPLEQTGINITEFCKCVHSKMGEKFDDKEALTIGLLHNPAKQICSDLATVCLPEEKRKEIARYQRTALRYYLSRMHPSMNSNKLLRLFVTPNGFAQYFGAPQGDRLDHPDQISEPRLLRVEST